MNCLFLPAKTAKYRKNLLDIGLIFISNFFLYHQYWLHNKFFTGNDFFNQLVPLINYQSDCLRSFSFPLWNPFVNLGHP
ncbi:MAG: hypothetical protein PHV17_04620 [Candidatus Omnitrophica bacterium]|nr:hypothetical protein [Candidatus Omnitrophota bacterium]